MASMSVILEENSLSFYGLGGTLAMELVNQLWMEF